MALTKDKNNARLAGVCAGIAREFNIDPTIVRLFFVLTAIFSTVGFWAYIVLVFIMPED